jgi:MFS family permease
MALSATGGRSRNLILAAMIFAVSMTFIDQTIVSIAVPQIQRELGLSSTGVQWAVNAYLLSLAALFAFGGRLADTVGHRPMVTLGVIVFAAASAMCGLTPKGSLAEAWIVTFRVIQGAGGAIMFPAALAIVVQTFPLRQRGKALALFFGIAGGLTAIGPLLGGFLTQWTWRAIFWVNIPVAVIALVLIYISRPATEYRPARIDYRGLVLIASGVALSVFGFQQSGIWGWSNPGTGLCIAAGAVLLVVFYLVEERTPAPLMQVRIFRIRAFRVENLVLGVATMVFIPVFFFASEYAQISLGKTASQAGLFLLYFFIGFPGLRPRRGRVLPMGGQGHRPQLRHPAVVHHFGRRRHGLHARPGQHGRGQPGVAADVRRGHRHHPDGAELHRQPGTGHPGHDPGHRDAEPAHYVAGRPRAAAGAGAGRGGGARPVAGVFRRLRLHRERWWLGGDPAVLPGGLRLRDADRVLRDGRDHGRGHDRGAGRPAAGAPGGAGWGS